MIPILYLHAMTELIFTDKASHTSKMLQEIRSSRAALFCNINVLWKFTIFIEKHLWWSPRKPQAHMYVTTLKKTPSSVFLCTKFWPNLICLGKQGETRKQKQSSKRKEYAMQSWHVLIFSLYLLRSVEALVLTKLRYTVQHCLMGFKFHDW